MASNMDGSPWTLADGAFATDCSRAWASRNQTLNRRPVGGCRPMWVDSHAFGGFGDCACRRRPALAARNCADDRNIFGYFRAQMSTGEANEMQLSQMWREHLQAGRPPAILGLNIAGTAASALDAEITACVSACVTHQLRMDARIE